MWVCAVGSECSRISLCFLGDKSCGKGCSFLDFEELLVKHEVGNFSATTADPDVSGAQTDSHRNV